jgi:hypothetical protein
VRSASEKSQTLLLFIIDGLFGLLSDDCWLNSGSSGEVTSLSLSLSLSSPLEQCDEHAAAGILPSLL